VLVESEILIFFLYIYIYIYIYIYQSEGGRCYVVPGRVLKERDGEGATTHSLLRQLSVEAGRLIRH
jgi:hypothetical protein